MKIRIVITGRSYHTAEQAPDELTLSEGASVKEALAALLDQLGENALPDSCLVSVSGQHLGTLVNYTPQELREGDELVLIAPVAGG